MNQIDFYSFSFEKNSPPRWQFWLARIFGEKHIGGDEFAGKATIIEAYLWRGRLYVWSISGGDIPDQG